MKKLIGVCKDCISFVVYCFLCIFNIKRNVALLYHSVGHAKKEDDPYGVNVNPDEFEKHLKLILRQGNGIDITFDDGYANNFENAFPLLKKYNMTATFFLATDFLDGKIKSEALGGDNFKERPLTWDEVRTMNKEGMRFGSHSLSHSLLSNIQDEQLNDELKTSKSKIEKNLGQAITTFAYPYGNSKSFNGKVKKELENLGYERAYTNIMGSNPSNSKGQLELKRIRVYGSDTPFKLKMKIKGAYDWVDTFNGTKTKH